MFPLLLAANVTAPTPINQRVPDVRAIFRPEDFPSYLTGSRTVYTRTTVRPDGGIQGCIAEVSSGDAWLDAYTCRLIVSRAKFAPAKWSDGSAAYGVVRVPVNWAIVIRPPTREQSLKATAPDLELSVNQLPKGADPLVAINLEIGADEKGRPQTCEEAPVYVKSDPGQHFPELVTLACQQVMTNFTVTPPVDSTGRAVRSVQSVSVYLELDPARRAAVVRP